MKVSRIVILALAVIVSMPALAALEDGEKELTASFSYQTQDFDNSDVEFKDTQIDVDFGYLLTHNHEIGGRLAWSKTEEDPGNFDFDSTRFGVFYHFNFGMEGVATPFAGAFYTAVGGDEGDFVDSEYGVEGGAKIYPWENGGFIVKAVWAQFTGNDPFPDGDSIGLFAGIGLKWK